MIHSQMQFVAADGRFARAIPFRFIYCIQLIFHMTGTPWPLQSKTTAQRATNALPRPFWRRLLYKACILLGAIIPSGIVLSVAKGAKLFKYEAL